MTAGRRAVEIAVGTAVVGDVKAFQGGARKPQGAMKRSWNKPECKPVGASFFAIDEGVRRWS